MINRAQYLSLLLIILIASVAIATKAEAAYEPAPAVYTSSTVPNTKLYPRDSKGFIIQASHYDTAYEVVDFTSLMHFWDYYDRTHNTQVYVLDRYDCDDFSRAFNSALIQQAYHPANYRPDSSARYAPAVAEIHIYWTEVDTQGVKQHYGHMASLILTNRGWYVIDATNHFGPIPLSQYKYRDNIERAIF